MLARLKRDVLDKKPQIMTLSCGVNDVGHGKRGVELPDFKKNITAIVEQAQAEAAWSGRGSRPSRRTSG